VTGTARHISDGWHKKKLWLAVPIDLNGFCTPRLQGVLIANYECFVGRTVTAVAEPKIQLEADAISYVHALRASAKVGLMR
jgi:hypothetical protein